MRWSKWNAFPDSKQGGYLRAPFGPGVYQLRRRSTGQLVLFGRGKRVAVRMTSLLPKPLGTGTRNNVAKIAYVHEHLVDIEYRTKPCVDEASAKAEERCFDKRAFLFDT